MKSDIHSVGHQNIWHLKFFLSKVCHTVPVLSFYFRPGMWCIYYAYIYERTINNVIFKVTIIVLIYGLLEYSFTK